MRIECQYKKVDPARRLEDEMRAFYISVSPLWRRGVHIESRLEHPFRMVWWFGIVRFCRITLSIRPTGLEKTEVDNLIRITREWLLEILQEPFLENFVVRLEIHITEGDIHD